MTIEQLHIKLVLQSVNFKRLARSAEQEIDHQRTMDGIKIGGGIFVAFCLLLSALRG